LIGTEPTLPLLVHLPKPRDAINTEEPRTNENRMRAVAVGVAVARGWIVPTNEGISLMRKSVAELDAPPSKQSDDDNDDD
jgi:hypothetical protein